MKSFILRFKRFIIFLCIVTLSSTTYGCRGNQKQVQSLFLVLALGVDSTTDDRVQVTMQVLNPNVSAQTGTIGGGATGNDVIIISGTGDTLFDAIFEASKTMSRVQHFGHLKYIAIGEDLARKGIYGILESFIRIHEFRLNTPMLIAKGKASEIVKIETPKNPISANVVEDLFIRQELIGFRPFSYLIDFQNSLGSEKTSPTLAVIRTDRSPESSDKTLFIGGAAVFKKDKLDSFLTDKETRGLQWVNGKVKVGNITFVSDKFGKVSSEILRASSKVKPIITDDKVSIKIDVKVLTDLRRVDKAIDPVKNPEILSELSTIQGEAVRDEIELTLTAAKDTLGLDIFGFGELIHETYPKVWKTIENQWDTIYRDLEVDINVSSGIRSTGLTNKSVR